MKLFSLWTWLIIVSIWKYLPPTHPWKQRERCFTLREWYENSTMNARAFDLFFWVSAFTLPKALVTLAKLLT